MYSQGPLLRGRQEIKKSVEDMTMEVRGWSDMRKDTQAKEYGWPLDAEKG